MEAFVQRLCMLWSSAKRGASAWSPNSRTTIYSQHTYEAGSCTSFPLITTIGSRPKSKAHSMDLRVRLKGSSLADKEKLSLAHVVRPVSTVESNEIAEDDVYQVNKTCVAGGKMENCLVIRIGPQPIVSRLKTNCGAVHLLVGTSALLSSTGS